MQELLDLSFGWLKGRNKFEVEVASVYRVAVQITFIIVGCDLVLGSDTFFIEVTADRGLGDTQNSRHFLLNPMPRLAPRPL